MIRVTKKPKVLIVGGGPAGMLLATVLGRMKGVEVIVHEMSAFPAAETEFGAQSCMFTINDTGMQALKDCLPKETSKKFWSEFEEHSTTITGVHWYKPNVLEPERFPHVIKQSSVTKQGLIRALYLNILAENLEDVHINFNSKVRSLTYENRTGLASAIFDFVDGKGDHTAFRSSVNEVSVVFGCDGKNSVVRNCFQGDEDENGVVNKSDWGRIECFSEQLYVRRILEVPYGWNGWKIECQHRLDTDIENVYVSVSTYPRDKMFRGDLCMTKEFIQKYPLVLSTNRDDAGVLSVQLQELFGTFQKDTFSDFRIARILETTVPLTIESAKWYRVEHFASRTIPMALIGNAAHSFVPTCGLSDTSLMAALVGVCAMRDAILTVSPEGATMWVQDKERVRESFRVYEDTHKAIAQSLQDEAVRASKSGKYVHERLRTSSQPIIQVK